MDEDVFSGQIIDAEAGRRINTFSLDCQRKFGSAVGKIPLDLGMPCPNRRNGGCIFCRPDGFTPGCLISGDSLQEQIHKGKKHLLKGRFKRYFAYFQQETCTAFPEKELLNFCQILLEADDCVGLILSTRPDFIEDSFLSSLAEIVSFSGKQCLIELGLQSFHQKSLDFLRRHHSVLDFCTALERIRRYKIFGAGVHLILGIPGESEADMISSVEAVCARGIDALKLHHLQVVKDTDLASMYQQRPFHLFTKEEYLELLLTLLVRIPENVVLHRLWGSTHPEWLIAPRWNVLAAELSRQLLTEMEKRGIVQGLQVKGETYKKSNENVL